jgi:predicted transcriptional regulator YdeE
MMNEFKLIGLRLKGKTTNAGEQASIDCGNLWQTFESEKYRERIPGSTGNEIYAVYFEYEGDFTKPYSYFIGCKVDINTTVPAGLDSITIPTLRYKKIVTKGKMPDCVADAWREIWKMEIPRAYQFDFEIYDHRSHDWNDAEVDIYLSLKEV